MATSNVRITERRNTTYKQGDVLQFFIDGATVPMLDPTNTFIRMNVNVGGKGVQTGYSVGDEADIGHLYPYTFNNKIGAEAIVKQLTIKNFQDVVLEQIPAYNILCRAVANTTQNDTMSNLKKLYCGADELAVKKTNTLTKRLVNNDANTQENMEVEVLIPLSCSGILGGKNREPLPVSALGGIIVEVQLEDEVWKCVRFQGDTVMDDPQGDNLRNTKNFQQQVLGYSENTSYTVDTITPAFNSGAVTQLTLKKSGVAGVITGDITETDDCLNTPFYNGQRIVIGTTNPVEVKVSKVGHDVGGSRVALVIPATDFSTNLVANPYVYAKYTESANGKPDINLSNVELICGVADASPKQLSALSSQVGGAKGFQYSFPSFGHFSVNLSANSLRTSSYIPANYSRAVMLLSTYENISESADPTKDNLCAPVDSSTKPLSYQFIIDNRLVPTRSVSLSRYNNNRTQTGGWGQIHVKQLTDALHCANYQTRDLSDLDGCLCIGQCLAPRPHTYNMQRSDGEMRININFDGTQTRALLLHNYLYHLKTIMISKNGVMVAE